MNSKPIAGILIAGTLVLGGASAYAAMLPSHLSATSGRHEVSSSHRPSNAAASGGGAKSLPFTTRARSPVTFTVKRGDTLPDVANWFTRHGYGTAWAYSSSEFTSEAHLLFPGERLIVDHGNVTVAPPLKKGATR